MAENRVLINDLKILETELERRNAVNDQLEISNAQLLENRRDQEDRLRVNEADYFSLVDVVVELDKKVAAVEQDHQTVVTELEMAKFDLKELVAAKTRLQEELSTAKNRESFLEQERETVARNVGKIIGQDYMELVALTESRDRVLRENCDMTQQIRDLKRIAEAAGDYMAQDDQLQPWAGSDVSYEEWITAQRMVEARLKMLLDLMRRAKTI